MATYYVDTANGSDSNGGLSEGDAFATIQHAVDTAAANSTIYVEGTGNYNEEVIVDDKDMTIIGYSSTPGDNGRVVIDGQSTRTTCITMKNTSVSNADFVFRNFELKNATGDGLLLQRNTGGANSKNWIDNVSAHDNGGHGIHINWNGGNTLQPVTRCFAYDNTGDGFHCGTNSPLPIFAFCKAIGNGGLGIDGASKGAAAYCLSHSNTDDNFGPLGVLINCTSDDSGSDGWVNYSNNGFSTAINCGFTNNGAYGIRNAGTNQLLLFSVGVNSNTTANYLDTPRLNIGEVTSSPSYNDQPNDDFTLSQSSAWKQQSLVVGLEDGSELTYSDIGAFQINVTGGGGGLGISQGMHGIESGIIA